VNENKRKEKEEEEIKGGEMKKFGEIMNERNEYLKKEYEVY
jgi:galactokinase